MATAGTISLKVTASESGTNDYGTPSWVGTLESALTLTSGTGLNQFDKVFFDERTVASATNDDIDLQGALTTPIGATFLPVEIVAIAIVNKPKLDTTVANTTNLTIGGGSAATIVGLGTALPAIAPGGMFMIVSPSTSGISAVTATTADILRVANSSGASATYQIAVFGRSA